MTFEPAQHVDAEAPRPSAFRPAGSNGALRPQQSTRVQFLGMPLDSFRTSDAVRLAEQAMRERRRLQHGDVNVAKFVAFRKDAELLRCTTESDIICVDGMGIVWGCQLMGVPVPERVAGIDLMMRIIELCARQGLRPYFLGAKQAVVEEAVAAVRRRHPEICIAGLRNGYFGPGEEDDVVRRIRESRADCLFVGMASPLKEKFLNKHRDALGVPVQLGVGGSFDVLSGRIARAPVWMQAWGMEWFFRLAQEPSRLLRRYFSTNGLYVVILALALARKLAGRLRSGRNEH